MSEISSSALPLFLMLLANVCVRQSSSEEECAEGCRALRSGTTELSRCVKYACRKKVFRYYIRFGKRTSGLDKQKEKQKVFPSSDDNDWSELFGEPGMNDFMVNLGVRINHHRRSRIRGSSSSNRADSQREILSFMKRLQNGDQHELFRDDKVRDPVVSDAPMVKTVADDSPSSSTTLTRLFRLLAKDL